MVGIAVSNSNVGIRPARASSCAAVTRQPGNGMGGDARQYIREPGVGIGSVRLLSISRSPSSQ